MRQMRDYLLFLEDSDSRYKGLIEALVSYSIDLKPVRANTAASFIAIFDEYQDEAAAISLDHDLFEDMPEDTDAGDGRDVSLYLSTVESVCPVIIHSSNADAAATMHYQLKDSGWTSQRVAPIGANWMTHDWIPVLERLI